MTTFSGRVEARMAVPTGGAAVSATIPNGAGASTKTVAAGNYYLTTAGGVSSLLTTLQSALNDGSGGYPTTAAAMASAVQYGTWSAGWLFNITSGNDGGAFGGVTMTAVSSPTYNTAGPRAGIDLAIGFDSVNDAFSAGDVYDVTGTDDLAVAWVAYIPSVPASNQTIVSKYDGNDGWHVYIEATTGNIRFQGVNGTASLFNADAGTGSYHAAAWHVGIATIDRATGKARVGTRSLAGTSYVSSEATTAATTTAGTATLNVGDLSSAAGTAPTGSYVSAVYVGVGSGIAAGLSANLSTALTNFANAINAAWTVSLSTTTGLVSIGWTGYTTPTWSLSWTSTDLRDVLGFTANISGVTTTQTGTQQARGLWLPDCPINLEGDPKRAPLVSDARTSMSPTGQTITLVGNTYRRQRAIVWTHVPIAQVWDTEATYENGSWEEFVTETQLGQGSSWFSPGSPVQIYYSNAGSDALLGADATIAGWSIIGLNSVEPQKSDPNWTGLWRIEIPTLIAAGS